MKVALLYNLNRRASQAELEFDLPETIASLRAALSLAHEVCSIECARDIASWLAELLRFRPEAIFSVAEGYQSAVREAFYPALFEQLGVPFAGSDPTTMMFAQNKALSKSVADSVGVSTPNWAVAASIEDLPMIARLLAYPMLVKPNSEGSSIGIDNGAVVSNFEELQSRVRYVWEELANLALVEEYVPRGLDLSISYVEDLGAEIFGPVAYNTGGADMYDHDWKSRSYLFPNIVIEPRGISNILVRDLCDSFRRVIQALDVRGYARADFRLGPDGNCYFLEINTQVEMAEKAEFAVPVVRAGHKYDELVLHIVECAVKRGRRLPSSVGKRRIPFGWEPISKLR